MTQSTQEYSPDLTIKLTDKEYNQYVKKVVKKDNCKNLVYIIRGRLMDEDFVKVAETEDVQVSQMMAVEVNDEKICLANVNGKYY
ncbi:MAG TPA: hypothetical protein VGW09_06030, partial [Nitrososphaeraceae archaeon]|nr:hypothetical protein [Nitrososphaeraceae archaeon]